MLTNFVLNQNNILSNYSKPQPVKSQLSNKQVEKIVRQQDIVVNRFVNTLDNNIQNYLIRNIGKKDINFFLPIKNALWQLWNESWFLGQINAAEELRDVNRVKRSSKFSSNSKLVTFARGDAGDELLRADRKQRKQKVEKKERTKRVIEKKTDTKEVKELTQEERDKLLANREQRNNVNKIGTKQIKKDKISIKVDDKKYRFTDNERANAAYKQIQQLREQQEETIAPDLERTKFNESYLNSRLTTLANKTSSNFETAYRDRLNEVVPDYFNDNRSDKDKSYVTKIRRMYISNARNIDEYKEKNNVLTNIIDSYVEPEIEVPKIITNLENDINRKRNQLNKERNPNERKRLRSELVDLQDELDNEKKKQRKLDRNFDKVPNKSEQFISISESDRRKLNLTKDTYSIKELEKIRSDVRKNIRQQDQNFYNTKRIALTELNAAYNLGRLDYYLEKGIEYVRWEVSVEHKLRELNSSNKSDAGTIRSYNAKGNYDNLTGKYKGSVCPVCWERNGKVYSINEVTTNAELQIPVHPFCACILVPVKDDDDDNPKKNKKKFKVKTSDLLNNSVLKWAAGAGVVILGTAAMYAAFRMTRGKVVQPPLQEQMPKVTKLLPKSIQVPDYIKRNSDSVIDTIVDNQDQLLNAANKTKTKVVNVIKTSEEIEDIKYNIAEVRHDIEETNKLLKRVQLVKELDAEDVELDELGIKTWDSVKQVLLNEDVLDDDNVLYGTKIQIRMSKNEGTEVTFPLTKRGAKDAVEEYKIQPPVIPNELIADPYFHDDFYVLEIADLYNNNFVYEIDSYVQTEETLKAALKKQERGLTKGERIKLDVLNKKGKWELENIENTFKEELTNYTTELDELQQQLLLPELQPKRPKVNELNDEYVYVDAVPLNIPTKTVDITPYTNQVNTAISQDYLDEVDDVLEYAIQQRNNFNTINPASVVSSSTRNELDDIGSRLEQYKNYVSSIATKADKDAIIKQYRNDIRQLNNIINKYEQDNVLIYTEMRTLMSLRDEGITILGNTLGNVDDDIATIFGSTNIGRRLNQELVDLEQILINRYDDLNAELGGYYNQAKTIKEEITKANPRLTLDYLRRIKGNLTKSLTKIKPNEFDVNEVSDRLVQLEKMLSKVNKISAEDFFYYSDRLEQLTTYVKQFEKQITNTLLDVDLKSLIKQLEGSRNSDNDLLTAAIILSDYKDTIRQTYNKINGLNVAIILKFNTINS